MQPVTQALLIANVAIYLLQMLGAWQGVLAWLVLWPPGGNTPVPFMPWQLVTYSFLHGNLTHLLLNMLPLAMFGSELERLFGARGFAVFYLVSVVCAGLTHIVVTAGLGRDLAPILGASGGVFGLLLAFGLYYPRRRLMLLFPPIPIQAGYFVILYGLLELVLGVTGTAMGIAHFAHLGGMLGAFLFIVYRRPRASGR